MAVTYKVLGQSAPGATTSTTLYTCPGATQTVVSCVVVCNRGTTQTTFRVGVDVNAGGDSNEDYLVYDAPILPNESIALAHGITMDAGDLVRVYAGNTSLTFSAFGQERT